MKAFIGRLILSGSVLDAGTEAGVTGGVDNPPSLLMDLWPSLNRLARRLRCFPRELTREAAVAADPAPEAVATLGCCTPSQASDRSRSSVAWGWCCAPAGGRFGALTGVPPPPPPGPG